MKDLRIIALLALLNAGLANVGAGNATTNRMEHVRNLLDSASYSAAQLSAGLPGLGTNSLRNVSFIEPGPFAPLVVPPKKTGWSLWNNSGFKSLGRNYDQISLLEPGSILSQYEYDITYSFEF